MDLFRQTMVGRAMDLPALRNHRLEGWHFGRSSGQERRRTVAESVDHNLSALYWLLMHIKPERALGEYAARIETRMASTKSRNEARAIKVLTHSKILVLVLR
jgi:hypothetical protein